MNSRRVAECDHQHGLDFGLRTLDLGLAPTPHLTLTPHSKRERTPLKDKRDDPGAGRVDLIRLES